MPMSTQPIPHYSAKSVVARQYARGLLPGVCVCAAVALGAWGLDMLQRVVLGRAVFEPLVAAILLGAFIAGVSRRRSEWIPGMRFCSATLLEVAVALCGFSISAAALHAMGSTLLLVVMLLVTVMVPLGYLIGRLAGLAPRTATLVAFGNAICGNSAIASVAPVIKADPSDVTAAVSYTAIIGAATVAVLPLLQLPLGLNALQFGCFAGTLVYAVPQVIAATAPAGSIAVQMGTLVKLTRVLMLGPALLAAALFQRFAARDVQNKPLRLAKLLPWFVVGFLVAIAIRSANLAPEWIIRYSQHIASAFTCLAMAALGLSINMNYLLKAGTRMTLAVIGSVLILATLGLAIAKLV
jgi:uncharacterized integral membrane protein (TIGR00698 family)